MSETQKRNHSEQARINGAKSKGPITPEGKAKSSSNALKHGFAATLNVVLSIEEEPVFQSHLKGIRASFNPTNYMEDTLVDQLASISWRQARLVASETALLDAQMSLQNKNVCARYPDCADDNYFHLLQAWQALARPPQKDDSSREMGDPSLPPDGFHINSLELLRRYQTSLDRQFRNTLLNLRQYRKEFAPDIASGPAKPEEPSVVPPPPQETVPPEASKPKLIALRPVATAQTSRPTGKIESKTDSAGPVHPKLTVNSR